MKDLETKYIIGLLNKAKELLITKKVISQSYIKSEHFGHDLRGEIGDDILSYLLTAMMVECGASMPRGLYCMHDWTDFCEWYQRQMDNGGIAEE